MNPDQDTTRLDTPGEVTPGDVTPGDMDPADDTEHGALVVVGSGPGIGSHVAAKFASHGFKRIILLSRDIRRLSADAMIVRSAQPEALIDVVAIDLSIISNVRRALIEVDKRLNDVPLEAVFFNAARMTPSELLTWSAEDFEKDLHICMIGLYLVAQWAIPQLLELVNHPDCRPSLFATSGKIWKDPHPDMFSLSACKAGQRNLVTSLHKEYGPQGIHCGLVVVGGRVTEDAEMANPRNIAGKAWEFYSQDEDKWTLEVEILDPNYEKAHQSRIEQLREQEAGVERQKR